MALAKKYQSMGSKVKQQVASRKFAGGGTKYSLPEGVSFYNPKKGTTLLNIVPYVVSIDKHPAGISKGEIWYERRFSVHFNVGPEQKSYICPKSIGKRCPICEYRLKLAKSKNPDEEALKELKAKDRVLYNVLLEDDKEAGVQLWDVSFYNFTKKLEEEINEGSEELSDFAMPDESGKVLSVRFSEKSMGTNTFLECSRVDFKDRDEDLSDEVLESVVDLDTVLKVLPFEDLESIFLELDETNSDADGKEDKGKKEDKSKKEDKNKDKAKDKDDVKEKEDKEEAERLANAEKEKQRREAIRKEKEAAKAKAEKAVDGPECPGGGTFGVDTDNLELCDSCPVWEACITKKEG